MIARRFLEVFISIPIFHKRMLTACHESKQGAHNVDSIGITTKTAFQSSINRKEVVGCLRKALLKMIKSECCFGVPMYNFQKPPIFSKNQALSLWNQIAKDPESFPTYHWFPNFYRSHIPQILEVLFPYC